MTRNCTTGSNTKASQPHPKLSYMDLDDIPELIARVIKHEHKQANNKSKNTSDKPLKLSKSKQ